MGRKVTNKGEIPRSWKLLTGSIHGKKKMTRILLEEKHSAVIDLALANKIYCFRTPSKCLLFL